MDRNTLTGLVLAVIVIFGFMWLNTPSEEQRKAQEEAARRQAAAQQQAQQAQQPLVADTLATAELDAFRQMIAGYGVEQPDGSRTLEVGAMKATLTADAIGGTLDLNGTAVEIAKIINHTADAAIYPQALAALRASIQEAGRYRNFARFLKGDDSRKETLSNGLLAVELSSKGGMISKATLLTYEAHGKPTVEMFNKDTNAYGFVIGTTDARFDTKDMYFEPRKENDSTVVMTLDMGAGALIELRYTLPANSYLVRMEMKQKGMKSIIPPSTTTVDFQWTQKVSRHEEGRMFEERNSAIYYMYANGDVDNLSESSDDEKTLNEQLRWISFKNQFFSSVIVADRPFVSAQLRSVPFEKGTPDDKEFVKDMSATATFDYTNDATDVAAFTFFIGPNKYHMLSALDKVITTDTGDDLHLTKLIPLGWSFFRWINTAIIIPVFDFLGRFISNYGIIILLLTILIKLVLFPLTYKSMISQAKMRILAPDIKEINDAYPGQENAMKRQQKTMELYSRAGASPFSGCLPLLLQMPILFAMFTFFPSCIELRGEPFLWVKDLSAPDAIVSWNAQIPFITNYFGNHISLFCLLMTITNIIYTRINMQNQPSGNTMPGMKFMMYAMPIMFLVFFNNYAAGLSYYYFVSLLITIIQTYVFRRMVSEDKVRAQMAENAKKPKKKGGFMARLEEAQRRQQEELRKAQERNRRAGKGRGK